ncbi:hypothetical protein Srufu_004420 [Streptomyces libani subsp. rufus]|nr:hypothetical protein Srufu_004420 [Streptomyces libani subsp. rufus]
MNRQNCSPIRSTPPHTDAMQGILIPLPAPRSPLASYVLDQLPADLTAVTRSQSTDEKLVAKQCRMLRVLGDDTPPPMMPRLAWSSSTCSS